MVSLDEFLFSLATDLFAFVIASIAVYIFFQRRERASQQKLTKIIGERLEASLNAFIANMISNLRTDVFEPLEAAYTLLSMSPSPLKKEIDALQLSFESVLKEKSKAQLASLMEVRKKQWEIITSDVFLKEMQMVVIQWNREQWNKYLRFFGDLTQRIANLMDLYQSRLPSDIVHHLIEFESEIESFGFFFQVFPEFFSKVEETEIPWTGKTLAARKAYIVFAAEKLHLICKHATNLKNEFAKRGISIK